MNRTTRRFATRRLLCGAAMLGAFVATAACEVGVAEYPDEYYDGYPPDAYIATTAPIYYDGYPSYWWNGHWYYRTGGRWRFYRHEPTILYERRVHAPPPIRRNYEPAFHERVHGRFRGAPRGGGFRGAPRGGRR